jgi:glycosyltransferase involved in cell wall biosynthesis
MKCLLAIPALNEANTISRVIRTAKEYIPDVLVIDDGSEDDTAAAAARENVPVVRHEQNKGKGEAIKTAFAYAVEKGYDWVFTLDGDGQHDPHDLKGFFPQLDRYDLLLGNRMEDSQRVPSLRLLANRSSSAIVSALCGCRILDSQTGFRAYRIELIRALHLTSRRYELESEILIKASRQGFRIGHCRIQTIYAGEKSRFRNIADSAKFLWLAAKSLRWR